MGRNSREGIRRWGVVGADLQPPSGVLLTLITPLVLLAHLLFLLGSEIVLDVEGNTDLFGRLTLDHVGNRFACQVEQILDFQKVCGLKGSKSDRERSVDVRELDWSAKEGEECRRRFGRTRMSSNKVGWSKAAQKSLSQGMMSSVRRSSFFGSLGGEGNWWWYSQYCFTFSMILRLTF